MKNIGKKGVRIECRYSNNLIGLFSSRVKCVSFEIFLRERERENWLQLLQVKA